MFWTFWDVDQYICHYHSSKLYFLHQKLFWYGQVTMIIWCLETNPEKSPRFLPSSILIGRHPSVSTQAKLIEIRLEDRRKYFISRIPKGDKMTSCARAFSITWNERVPWKYIVKDFRLIKCWAERATCWIWQLKLKGRGKPRDRISRKEFYVLTSYFPLSLSIYLCSLSLFLIIYFPLSLPLPLLGLFPNHVPLFHLDRYFSVLDI